MSNNIFIKIKFAAKFGKLTNRYGTSQVLFNFYKFFLEIKMVFAKIPKE